MKNDDAKRYIQPPPDAQEMTEPKPRTHPDDCQCPIHATLFERCCSRWPHSLVIPCDKPQPCRDHPRDVVEARGDSIAHVIARDKEDDPDEQCALSVLSMVVAEGAGQNDAVAFDAIAMAINDRHVGCTRSRHPLSAEFWRHFNKLTESFDPDCNPRMEFVLNYLKSLDERNCRNDGSVDRREPPTGPPPPSYPYRP